LPSGSYTHAIIPSQFTHPSG